MMQLFQLVALFAACYLHFTVGQHKDTKFTVTPPYEVFASLGADAIFHWKFSFGDLNDWTTFEEIYWGQVDSGKNIKIKYLTVNKDGKVWKNKKLSKEFQSRLGVIGNVTQKECNLRFVLRNVTREDEAKFYGCTARVNGVGFKNGPKTLVIQDRRTILSIRAVPSLMSVNISWNSTNTNTEIKILDYRVILVDTITQQKREFTGINISNLYVTELKHNRTYVIKVQARNDDGYGLFKIKNFTTLEADRPRVLSITAVPSIVSVNISWNSTNDNTGIKILDYRIILIDTVTKEPRKFTSITLSNLYVAKLMQNRTYVIKVQARNEDGYGRLKSRNFTTLEADIPGAPVMKAIPRVRALLITWKPSPQDINNIKILDYRIKVLNCTFVIQEFDAIANTSFVINNLAEDGTYVVEIQARNDVGFGQTAKISATTLSAVLSSTMPTEFVTTSPPITEDSLFRKEKLLHAIYISVIVALLATVLTLVVVLCRLRKRLETQHTERIPETKTVEELIPMTPLENEEQAAAPPSVEEQESKEPNYEIPGDGDYMPLHPSTRSWEISREQVNVIKIIGKGAFSEVAKATVWNLRDNQKNITVAAKMLKASAPASDRKDLLSELELISKLKPHAHVIKLIGCVTESDPLLVLIEYVPFGDLLGYLRKSRGLNDTYFKDPDVKPQTTLTAEQLMKFAWQVADGMCYLSSKKIIHRDLAARNVLVGEGEKCKVTDFGMARNLQQDDIYSRKSRGRLPVKWTAYEALLFGVYTTQSDVWSYGILLYEIITVGGSPYPDINARQIAQKLQEGYRMPKPTHVDSKLYEIMLKCWEEQPTDRPTFEKLRKNVKEMEKHHKTYVNLSQYDNSLYANVKDLADE